MSLRTLIDINQKALALVKQAIAADKNEEYETAYTLYMSSLDWFMIAMKCLSNIKSDLAMTDM